MKQIRLMLTCEHGGFHIPGEFQNLFQNQENVLQSHRGWDPGALDLAQRLKKQFKCGLVISETSRLLIDLNRSLWRRTLFSEFTRNLDQSQREKILNWYYHPYQEKVTNQVAQRVGSGYGVIHLSIHSFTPVWNGEERNADIGLLYDPSRQREAQFSKSLRAALKQLDRTLKIRLNYPYLGKYDGMTARLRMRFTEQQYAGLEIEVNQKYPMSNQTKWTQLQSVLKESLNSCL